MPKIYASCPVTLDGPMVSFSDCQVEGQRSSHAVDVLDFSFTFFFQLDRFLFSLC